MEILPITQNFQYHKEITGIQLLINPSLVSQMFIDNQTNIFLLSLMLFNSHTRGKDLDKSTDRLDKEGSIHTREKIDNVS